MTEHRKWQETTSLKRVAAEQDGENPPPIAHSIAAAARYVGAEIEDVRRWWYGRRG